MWNKDGELTLKFKDFHLIEDELPDDFEVCLIVLKDGMLTAGCWDTGLHSRENGAPGCFRQSRGMSISIDLVQAWLPIEEYKIEF